MHNFHAVYNILPIHGTGTPPVGGLGDNDVRTRAAQANPIAIATTSLAGGVQSCNAYIDPARRRFWLPAPTTTFAEVGAGGTNGEQGRGCKWATTRGLWGQFTTISPPNCPLCMDTSTDQDELAKYVAENPAPAYVELKE